jgi:tetratricopeptide (TPR) repeat protein
VSARRGGVLGGLALALVVAVVFAGAVRGGFVYDDYWLVLHNASLREPGSLGHFLGSSLFAGVERSDLAERAAVGEQYWRPFVKLAFLAQYRLFGADPRGWHATSLLVHLASTLLVWRWLRARLGGGDPGSRQAAWLAAAVFAVHPARVEAVAWVSGSMDLWMGFWVLAGLWAWDARRAAGAAICFVLAALSKETAFVVPFALGQDAWAREAGWRSTRVRFAVLGVALGGVLAARLVALPPTAGIDVGAPAAAVLRGLACLGLFLGRTLWPFRPSTQIGLVSPDGRFDLPGWSVAAGAAAVVGLVALAWTARRKARARGALADLGWFLLPLVPVLQIVPLGYTTLVAERFLYLPLVGIGALAARALRVGMARGPRAARASLIGATGVAILFAVTTMRYIPAFRGEAQLWEYEARLAPENPLLHLYRARAASRAGEPERALAAALESYRCARLPDARAEAALLWATVRLQAAQGRERETLERMAAFLDALAGEEQPIRFDADGVSLVVQPSREFRSRVVASLSFQSSRAVANARAGRYEAAEAQLRDLLQRDRSASTFGNLARVLACRRKWDEALATIAAGLAQHPGDAVLMTIQAAIRRQQDLGAGGATAATAAARSRAWIDLGSTLLARRELEPWSADPAPPAAVVVAAALADAADGDPARARARLEAARSRDPAGGPAYDAASHEIRRLERPAPEPRLDDLFR